MVVNRKKLLELDCGAANRFVISYGYVGVDGRQDVYRDNKFRLFIAMHTN